MNCLIKFHTGVSTAFGTSISSGVCLRIGQTKTLMHNFFFDKSTGIRDCVAHFFYLSLLTFVLFKLFFKRS